MPQHKEQKTTVCIIMPAYNAAGYIRASIESVKAQTYTDWELLVIDDCSTDSTRTLVTAMAAEDGRIRLIENEQNLGASATRNRGLDLCGDRYVALLDCDDLWHAQKLEKQIPLLESTQADIVYTSYAMVNEEGNKVCQDFIVPKSTTITAMLKQNVIGCSTVLLSPTMAAEFRFTGDIHEDYILWLSALRAGKRAVGMEEILVHYRIRKGSRSSNKLESLRTRWPIYRRVMGLSVWKSLYYMLASALYGLRKYRKKD